MYKEKLEMDKLPDYKKLQNIIKYDPERLPALLAYNIKRNSMIGVSSNYGHTNDVMISYYKAVEDREGYLQAINFLESYIEVQMDALKRKIHAAKNETDLTDKKILLIDAMELEDDIKRLLKFNEEVSW